MNKHQTLRYEYCVYVSFYTTPTANSEEAIEWQ